MSPLDETKRINIRVTEGQDHLIERAAILQGCSKGTFVRMAAMKEANLVLGNVPQESK